MTDGSLSTSLSSCKPAVICPPGQFLDWEYKYVPGNYQLTYTYTPWGTLDAHVAGLSLAPTYACAPCPLGEYKPNADNAVAPDTSCPGSYERKAKECCRCPYGSSTQGTGSTDASQCSVIAAPSPAPTPYAQLAHQSCPLGQHEVYSGVTISTVSITRSSSVSITSKQCMPCNPSSYGSYCAAINDQVGECWKTLCCSKDTVFTNQCSMCPAGLQTAVIGATDISQCTWPVCPAGMYLPVATPKAAGAAAAGETSPAVIGGAVVGAVAFLGLAAAAGYYMYMLKSQEGEKEVALGTRDDLAAEHGHQHFPQPQPQHAHHPHSPNHPSRAAEQYPEYPRHDDDPRNFSPPPPDMQWQGRLSSEGRPAGRFSEEGRGSRRLSGADSQRQPPHFAQPQQQQQWPQQQHEQQHQWQEQQHQHQPQHEQQQWPQQQQQWHDQQQLQHEQQYADSFDQRQPRQADHQEQRPRQAPHPHPTPAHTPAHTPAPASRLVLSRPPSSPTARPPPPSRPGSAGRGGGFEVLIPGPRPPKASASHRP